MKRAFQWYATRSGWVAGRASLPQSCGASRVTARVVYCEHVIEENVFKVSCSFFLAIQRIRAIEKNKKINSIVKVSKR